MTNAIHLLNTKTEHPATLPGMTEINESHHAGNDPPSGYNEALGINITGNVAVDRESIENILRERNMTLEELLMTLTNKDPLNRINAPSSEGNPDEGSQVKWGIIVPIVLIVVFLLAVSACLFWHSWANKRREQRKDDKSATPRSRFTRSGKKIDFVRESTRSTTPLQAGIHDKVQVTPLRMQRNGKFSFYWDKDNWKLCPSDLQHTLSDVNNNTSILRQNLSPINEVDTPASVVSNLSRNYDINAQPPYSPYHLTYIHAPPPSYEESEISSPGKNTRIQSLQTTNTTQSEESCVKYGKSLSSPFYPHNNTPTTECELASEFSNVKVNSAATTNISQYTSYPSSPMSSAGSLTASNIDTGADASLMTSYQEPACPPSSLQSDYAPTTTQTSERNSQNESDFSGGVPSLPSSILYYHQRMTVNNNVRLTGKPPDFSPHAFETSARSSVISAETHYEDNTSLLPNVGSSNTSGNPTASIQFSTNPSLQFTNSMIPPFQNTNSLNPSFMNTNSNFMSTQNISAEDLSKIVNEMSSIRPGSNEINPNRGIISSIVGFDGTVGQSYVADVCPPQSGSDVDNNFHQSITELFRSWSVTAELDYSSVSSKATSQAATNESFAWDNFPYRQEKRNEENEMIIQASDLNHNRIELDKLPAPGRRVKFDVPILVNKTYWV